MVSLCESASDTFELVKITVGFGLDGGVGIIGLRIGVIDLEVDALFDESLSGPNNKNKEINKFPHF